MLSGTSQSLNKGEMSECLELCLLDPKPLPIWHTKLLRPEKKMKLKPAFHCGLRESRKGLEMGGYGICKLSFMYELILGHILSWVR